jgi:hypothetical protein
MANWHEPTAHGLTDAQWEEGEQRAALEEDWRLLVADMEPPDDLSLAGRDWLYYAGIYTLDDWLLSWRIEHE